MKTKEFDKYKTYEIIISSNLTIKVDTAKEILDMVQNEINNSEFFKYCDDNDITVREVH